MFTSFSVISSGLEAQRVRLNTISSNLANINTTRGPGGEPYRRKDVLFTAIPANNEGLVKVKVLDVIEDGREFKVIYEPGHPDADKDGFVKLPNIDSIEEMVNMLSAIRAYEANVSAFNSTKEMMQKALEIGR
ncbi:MAG: flagellar basal body rod protein FlgC [Thermodesulfobacteriota bacterium]